MKNKRKSLAIIAIVAIIGLGFAACGGDDDNTGGNNNGTHTHTYVYTVTSTSYPAQSTPICSSCGNTDTARDTIFGDRGPAGGTIFYIEPSGFKVQGYTGTTGSFAEYTAHYLEAALLDEGNYLDEFGFFYSEWGAYGTLIADVTTFSEKSDSKASLIGNGRRDTQIIVNHLDTTEETGGAAQICASKTVTVGGTVFNDWFLPSLGELKIMYEAKKWYIGTPFTGDYWSSSQRNNNYAWKQDFIYGNQYQGEKELSRGCVRAVRAF